MSPRLVIIISLILTSVGAKNLWCYQGGANSYTPGQCRSGVLECFKYECVNEANDKTSFIARGCGLPESSNKSFRLNDSCLQAKTVCDQLGAKGVCSTCVRGHMCNSSSSLFGEYSLIWTFLAIVFIRIML